LNLTCIVLLMYEIKGEQMFLIFFLFLGLL